MHPYGPGCNFRIPWPGIALLALCAPFVLQAHTLTMDECMEGGDFVANAAHARDAGMARSAFVAKLEEDIQLIQAFPPQLRWFVQDDEDALFLLGATTRVFDLPRKAEVHRGEFLVACLERGAKKDPEGTGEARGHDT